MHRLLVLLIITITIGTSQRASAGPFEDGLAAYNRRDFATALKLWQPLAERGDFKAQSQLGWMYDRGQGVAQNYIEAAKWFRLAADQGDGAAQYNLGNMYARGEGVPQDYQEMVKLWRKAAVQAYSNAQHNLGVAYEYGRGAPQNYVRAYMWFNLAASISIGEEVQKVATDRDRVAAKMTPTQIAQAQELAHKCYASGYKNCND